MKEPGPADIAEWENATAARPKNLEWHGWTPESGVPQLNFFNTEKVSCKCVIPCEKCGFNYLDDRGGQLKRTSTPLCGKW